jgi:hypothetical protein
MIDDDKAVVIVATFQLKDGRHAWASSEAMPELLRTPEGARHVMDELRRTAELFIERESE